MLLVDKRFRINKWKTDCNFNTLPARQTPKPNPVHGPQNVLEQPEF